MVDIGTFVVAVLALNVSLGVAVYTKFANDRSLAIAAGAAETSLMDSISAAWDRIALVQEQVSELTNGRDRSQIEAHEEVRLQQVEHRYLYAVERLCDQYEVACGRYLDGKCDRVRFKKSYHDAIRQLVQNNISAFAKVLNVGPASKYTALLKVYDEWHNLEK